MAEYILTYAFKHILSIDFNFKSKLMYFLKYKLTEYILTYVLKYILLIYFNFNSKLMYF